MTTTRTIQGPRGPRGYQGNPGRQGEKGDKGDQGDPGPVEEVVQSWESKYFARGVEKAGIPDGEAGSFYDEFIDISHWYKSMGSASAAPDKTELGGVLKINAGNNDQVLYSNGTGTYSQTTVFEADGRWYIAERIRLPVTMNESSGAYCQPQVDGGSDCFELGFDDYWGPGRTKFNFVSWDGSHDGEVLESTVSLDTAWHDYEAWSDGTGTYYLSVDDETPVSFTPTNPISGLMYLVLYVWGQGATTQIKWDRLLVVFPQAT